MENFVKIVNGLKETCISSKNSIIDVLQGFFFGTWFFSDKPNEINVTDKLGKINSRRMSYFELGSLCILFQEKMIFLLYL